MHIYPAHICTHIYTHKTLIRYSTLFFFFTPKVDFRAPNSPQNHVVQLADLNISNFGRNSGVLGIAMFKTDEH